MKHVMSSIASWIRSRITRLPERDGIKTFWIIFVCWLASMAAAVVVALGNPTGATAMSRAMDIGKALGLNLLAFVVITLAVAIIFSFIYIPIPRLAAGSFIYTGMLSVIILYKANSGTVFSYVAGIGYALMALIFGFIIMLLIRSRRARFIIGTLVIVAGVVGGLYTLLDGFGNTESATVQVASNYTEPITAENPGKHGSYDVTFMTYGSGTDVQRDAFGPEVDETTSSVDASSFITRWDDKREDFWGVDPSNLPVNGRVWIPKGEGPFPVILMVHGNHTMENFSTDGYDYLGEQLASRGFLSISVDEDFVNYSNITGQPNDNYELRAWMMLQHLVQLKTMNASTDSQLYKKLDLNNVALMGHSRGGQAAPMAADYESFFQDEQLLHEMEDIHIKAVAALAPTDKTIDGKKPNLHNVSYIVLQGASDADISDFRGDRQFYRTTFDSDNDGFKTTLYIKDANHTQFNTSWGKNDLSYPRGVFLNKRGMMPSEDQRQIAKVYLSAFFERVFHGETSYDSLFKDYRNGADWLPDATLVNKYRNASYRSIQQFDADESDVIDTGNFIDWEVTTPLDRGGGNQAKDALDLAWDKEATYEVDLAKEMQKSKTSGNDTQLELTMANIDEEQEEAGMTNIDMELETTEGVSVTLPLNNFMPFPPVIKTDYTTFGLFDGIFREGKYEEDWEPIFQTISIPVHVFEESNPDFKTEDINKMRLHFKGEPGEILLEEVGVSE